MALFRSVRARVTVAATLLVAIALTVAAVGLLTAARQSLVDDVRGTLTENLAEAQTALNRGVITELTLLSLGLTVDPLAATTQIVDEQCAPILAAAYGDEVRAFETYYFFEDLSDDAFFEYDDCVVAKDPFFDSVFECDEIAIEAIGNPQLTFTEFQEAIDSEEFDRAVNGCLEEALLVDERVEEASVVCDPALQATFSDIDVLDEAAVDTALQGALGDYAECMRANGVDEYPDLSVAAVESEDREVSTLASVIGANVVFPSLTEVRASVKGFGTAVAIATPALIVLLAVLVFLVVGRVLRPVEAIRARVAEIGAKELSQRVPDPGTDDEVGRLAGTMNEMLSRLEKSADRQRQFISDASHELRSPIASIRAQLEVSLAHPDSAAWPTVAEGVLDENLRMERLVDDLLTIARADEGVILSHTERVDMGEVVRAEMERFDDGVSVQIADEEPIVVSGDALALRRVVRNLADNAHRHAASTVEISLSQVDGVVSLTVDDDGNGVSPDERDLVFDRFTRLEEGRTRDAGGAGLGLAVVREIASSHRGSVSVADSPLGGARFVVNLPAAS